MRTIIILGAVALAGCVEVAEPDGQRTFVENCASCHGLDAKGSGPMSRNLIKMAPNLTTLASRNGGVFPRDYVMSTIDGLDRGSHFSGAMPEFGAGDMGDTIIVEENGIGTPVPADLLALTAYLEGLQG
ncbi:MAG: cytochrome c [Yoonia sp.]|nr:cytochrome c [Yoonia sp.]